MLRLLHIASYTYPLHHNGCGTGHNCWGRVLIPNFWFDPVLPITGALEGLEGPEENELPAASSGAQLKPPRFASNAASEAARHLEAPKGIRPDASATEPTQTAVGGGVAAPVKAS